MVSSNMLDKHWIRFANHKRWINFQIKHNSSENTCNLYLFEMGATWSMAVYIECFLLNAFLFIATLFFLHWKFNWMKNSFTILVNSGNSGNESVKARSLWNSVCWWCCHRKFYQYNYVCRRSCVKQMKKFKIQYDNMSSTWHAPSAFGRFYIRIFSAYKRELAINKYEHQFSVLFSRPYSTKHRCFPCH